MNLTLSLDEATIERARAVARQQGKSLNALVREYLERLVGEQPGGDTAEALLGLMRKHGGHSGGKRVARDELYRRRP